MVNTNALSSNCGENGLFWQYNIP